jgi:putative transposase
MPARRIYDREGHAQFVTFSCYRRRRLLDYDRAKRCVLGALNAQLVRLEGRCAGFVIMPNHVHAILWCALPGQMSECLKQWKRMSSIRIKETLALQVAGYAATIDPAGPVWQAKYYAFNLFSPKKIKEKLNYMHLNPVRAGLVDRAADWRWSSARWYEQHRTVGVKITPLE